MHVKPSEIVVSILAGLLAALGIDLFGVLALIVVTILLVVGIALRARVVVLACAIASGAILALWALATTRCDPTIGNCALETPLLVGLVWVALVGVVGLAATLLLVARSRPR